MRTISLAAATIATILLVVLSYPRSQWIFPARSDAVPREKSVPSLLSQLTALPDRFLKGAPSRSVDVESGRKTILLLGESGPGWTAGELTDTILLVVLEPQRERGTIISIPRDLLVRLPSGATTKINALWIIGKQDAARRGAASISEESALIVNAVQEITGIPIDDVAVVDVRAVASLIDQLGGITVQVTERIDDPAFPTPGGGIERFTIEPGFHVLDGETAVKYARTRHTREGDFGRMRRQQQVLEAVAAKAIGLRLPEDLPKAVAILQTLQGNIETTIDLTEIPALITHARRIPLGAVQTFALETLRPANGTTTGERRPLLVSAGSGALLPSAGTFDYHEIREAIAELME